VVAVQGTRLSVTARLDNDGYMPVDEIPPYHEFLWPAVQAVRELGGSASISEMVETVIKRGNFTDAQQAVLHQDGPGTEIAYRLAWARTYLKGMGLLTNSARGVWTLTDEGTALVTNTKLSDDARRDWLRSKRTAYLADVAKRRKSKPGPAPDGAGDFGDAPTDTEWKEQLLDHLMAMSPDSFERLSRRLLREADFDSVTVTGKSGDQGIDGVGIYRMGLVTFPVFFQCKRYRGSVGSSAVRDFRGAMSGRGDKGLLITTGSFTAEARNESTRQGTTPVDLIDGDRLCDLLKKYELGVQTKTRQEETVTVDGPFFIDV
jgi:restriction system protein